MSPERLIDEICDNLAAERMAVIELDGERVSALGEEKDKLVELLAVTPIPRELMPRLRDLVAMARHNCQLVAHAREALRGTATIVASSLQSGGGSVEVPPRRGLRVSVTG